MGMGEQLADPFHAMEVLYQLSYIAPKITQATSAWVMQLSLLFVRSEA